MHLGRGSKEPSHQAMLFPPMALWVLPRPFYVTPPEGLPEGHAVRRQSYQEQRP